VKNTIAYDGRGLYAGTAGYYSRYRPPYPPSLATRLRERFGLDGRGRLLDLGCGPGSVAIAVAHLFEQVIAVDPEPEMLAEAARIARERAVTNIQWRCARAEDLDDSIGRFRVVSAGNSFHWMDRERVLDFIYPIIESGGGIAVVGQGAGIPPPPPTPWRTAITRVIERYLGTERHNRYGVYKPGAELHDAVLARSRLVGLTEYIEEFEPEWSFDTILGNLYSMSFCSRALLGDRVNDFERDLRAALAEVCPSGRLRGEIGVFWMLTAYKR
jgi:ubiquinone/menaquinone biosynthesis C-methylase UbiE